MKVSNLFISGWGRSRLELLSGFKVVFFFNKVLKLT